MTDAPERIKLALHPGMGCDYWSAKTELAISDPVEYVRADLMSQWQPIETAPQDGVVLLYFANRVWRDLRGASVNLGAVRDMAEKVEVGFCDNGDVCEAGTGHSMFEDCRKGENWPTHWMPLPAQP